MGFSDPVAGAFHGWARGPWCSAALTRLAVPASVSIPLARRACRNADSRPSLRTSESLPLVPNNSPGRATALWAGTTSWEPRDSTAAPTEGLCREVEQTQAHAQCIRVCLQQARGEGDFVRGSCCALCRFLSLRVNDDMALESWRNQVKPSKINKKKQNS